MLDEGTGGRLSIIMIDRGARQVLLVGTPVPVDLTGSLTLLLCPSDTGMGQAMAFFVPSASTNIEFPEVSLSFT